MSSIFLSHSHRDKEFAAALSEQLQARGIRTWLDEAEMQVGDSLIARISTAIQEFAYLGVILSPHSVESPWVHLEVRTALTEEIQQRRVKVLPLLYQKCNIPPFLRDKIYADFTEDFDRGLQRVVSRLTADLHGDEHKRKRARESLLLSYQDWTSFSKRDEELLRPEKLMSISGFLDFNGLSADLLEYLARSTALAIEDGGKLNIDRLATAIGRLDESDARRVTACLLAEGGRRMRLAGARLLSHLDFGGPAPSQVLFERLGMEPDPSVRRELHACAYRRGWGLPEDVARVLLSQETDWLCRSYTLRSLPGRHPALLISDGSDFASQLGALAGTAGFLLVTMPPFALLMDDAAFEDHLLDAYDMVMLVRGEHFAKGGMHELYDWLGRYVTRGGTLFATSWAGWETENEDFAAVLPFEQVRTTFFENILITCSSKPLEQEHRLTGSAFSFRASFEFVHAKPQAAVMLETDRGIPILGYQPFGAGLSYYLNTCQHSCQGPMESPLRQSPELAACLQRHFESMRSRQARLPPA